MISLTADSKSYGNTGQYIARITGRDKKYGYSREFVGRKNRSITTAYIDEPGIYEVCDIDKKGRKAQNWRLIANRPADCPAGSGDKDLIAVWISDETLAIVTKRMDAGEALDAIVGFQPSADGAKYEYFIRSKTEAKQASAAVTIDAAVETCWAVLGALPEREAKKVLAALKLRVSPPKPAPVDFSGPDAEEMSYPPPSDPADSDPEPGEKQ